MSCRSNLPRLSSAYCNDALRTTAPIARSPLTARLHVRPRDLKFCGHDCNTPRSRIIVSQGASPRYFSHTPARRRAAAAAAAAAAATPNPSPPPPRSPKKWRLTAGVALALLAAYNVLLADPVAPDQLNKERFTPCTVVSREPISPTAFLLTIRVPRSRANRTALKHAHEYGLWSVEVKQPQLQIARNYTPLPPSEEKGEEGNGGGDDDDELRFFVRRYETGEVSKYLSRLAPGDTIEIRGPHLGFDLGARLGGAGARDEQRQESEEEHHHHRRHVVFLAGGTGIAPAMQAARRLLQQHGSNQGLNVAVQILWANRASADCAGCVRVDEQQAVAASSQSTWGQKFSSFLHGGGGRRRSTGHNSVEGGSSTREEEQEQPSLIIAQLKDLQAQYAKVGRELRVKCAIDEEGSKFAAQDIADAVTASAPRRLGASLPSTSTSFPGTKTMGAASLSCFYHSQRQLQDSTEELDAGETEGGIARTCTCDNGAAGRNLFIVSGPEGFVRSYVGSKVWARGAERQGPVGGVVAELMRKNPTVWSDWLVLKQ